MKLAQHEMRLVTNGFALANEIIDRVCIEYGIPRDVLMSRNRSKTLFEARKVAMRRVRMQAGLSQPEIAKLFDRDASTVTRALA